MYGMGAIGDRGGGSEGPMEEIAGYHFCDSHLNFSTASNEEDEFYQKRRLARDPMSHRIIEKRRRDRMNNCLADLSRLIPADYLKKGRGRIEKTEIIEMAIKHMRHLQTIISTTRTNGEVEKGSNANGQPIVREHFRLGYLECLSEAMHFLVEIQGFFAADPLCVQMISHLHRHCDSILLSDSLNFPRQQIGETSSNSSNSTGAGASPPLGMSNSTGGQSYEHIEYATYSSESEEPAMIKRNHSTSSGVLPFSIKEETEGPSQLRDMLINSSKRSSSSGVDSAVSSEEHHMYKFKNNIQQRYNESQLQDDDEPPCKKVKKEELNICGRLSFGHKSLSRPMAAPLQQTQTNDVKPPGIPIFALHANGTYYIPLTLDQHSLASHMPALTDRPPQKAALHPVTISVNFQKPAEQPQ